MDQQYTDSKQPQSNFQHNSLLFLKEQYLFAYRKAKKKTIKELLEVSISLTSRAIVMKATWYLNKTRYTDHWNQIQTPTETLLFIKKSKIYNRQKKASSTKGAGLTGWQHVVEP